MDALEQRLIEVDGASLEVFLGGAGEPVMCQSHPFAAASADPADPASSGWSGWDSTMGRLVGVNPRGVGQSSEGREPRDFTFHQHVDDLEAVRRRLGVERWVFWGISGGGCIGLLYALRYPQALSGLILAVIGPSGRAIAADERSGFSPFHPQYRGDLARLTMGSPLKRHPAGLRSLEPSLASAEWVRFRAEQADENWVLLCENRPVVVGGTEARGWAVLEQFVTVFDVQDRLGEIRVPTLIGAGRQDGIVPLAHCELLHAGIPHAAFVELDDTGHDLQHGTADAARWSAAVSAFLSALPQRSASEPA